MATFFTRLYVASFRALSKPIAIADQIVSIETPHCHMLRGSRIPFSKGPAIEPGCTEWLSRCTKRVGPSFVRKPVSEFNHRTCVSAQSKVPEDRQPLAPMPLVADCQSSQVKPLIGGSPANMFHASMFAHRLVARYWA